MRPLRRLPNRLAFALPLLRRLPAIGALTLLAVGAKLCGPAPTSADEDGVAAMLGEAVGGEVARDAFVWERSRGWLADALLGRRALFLAAIGDAPRDLFRADVRVSREGRPIAVGDVVALTETPLGDEARLVARGRYAAFATRWDGGVQGVTVLDLQGEGTGPLAWLDDGWGGAASELGRIELAFRRPPTSLKMQLVDDELRMAVGPKAKAATLALDSLALDHEAGIAGEAWRQRPDGGPRLDLGDRIDRWWRRLRGADEAAPIEPEVALPSVEGSGWPPPAPAGSSWSPLEVGVVGDAPLLVASASVEGDALTLVAIDTRRLDVGYRAGRRHPEATTGPHGSGTVPRDLAPRVVGAFNGGAAGGAVDGGRVLVPPELGRATVAVDRHGQARLGALPPGLLRTGEIVAVRQGDVLIEDGQRPTSPGGRVSRSALGRTADGFLIYGFAAEASAQSLALALRRAGCVYAVALQRTDAPLGMVTWPQGEPGSGGVVDPSMSLTTEHVTAGAEHDFFYLVAREPHPQLKGLDWKPAPGRQPAPTAWPAIHVASTKTLGVEVSLHHVAPGRLRWTIVPGEKETAAQTAAQALDDEARREAVLAINLGLAFRKDNRRGLVLDGAQTLPMRPYLGAIEIDDGDLSITYTVEGLVPDGDATELPLLVEASTERRHTQKLGARRRRAAACTAEDGSLLVASAVYDTAEPVALALMDLGCERVVELNRGRQVRSFVYHAGSETDDDAEGRRELLGQYVETALFGLEASAARGRARGL